MKNTILKNKYFAFGLCFAVMLFIFSNSMKPAAISSEQSTQFIGLLNRIVSFLFGSDITKVEHIVAIVRKSAHFIEFFLLGACAYYVRYIVTNHSSKGILYTLEYGVFVALFDETIQCLFPDRGPQIKDVWIDFSGFTLAVIILTFIFTLLHNKISSRRKT